MVKRCFAGTVVISQSTKVKSYRSLGVAVQLRSAATRIVNEGQVPFLYAHPNDRMRIVHLRAGHKIIGQMVRFAMPLRFHRRFPRLPGVSWVSSGMAWSRNFVWSRSKQSRQLRQSFQAEIVDGFAAEAPFDSLLEQVRSKLPIFGLRKYEYLNWRFGMNPLVQLRTLLLYRVGQLVG
jgi:hypothetical protein